MTSVGFIGAGIMGAPMARNAAEAGLGVRLWNRSRDKAEAVEGVTVADSVRAAVDGVADELLDASGDDAVWVQMSTVGLDWTEKLSARAGERGVAYVDAPVSGTKQPAEQ